MAAASGLLDLNELAADELASRGCDVSGQWVGLAEAKALRAQQEKAVTADDVMDQRLTLIAQEECAFETLETRHRDSLDFRDVAVWCLRNALVAAYRAGAEAVQTVALVQSSASIQRVETGQAAHGIDK